MDHRPNKNRKPLGFAEKAIVLCSAEVIVRWRPPYHRQAATGGCDPRIIKTDATHQFNMLSPPPLLSDFITYPRQRYYIAFIPDQGSSI